MQEDLQGQELTKAVEVSRKAERAGDSNPREWQAGVCWWEPG